MIFFRDARRKIGETTEKVQCAAERLAATVTTSLWLAVAAIAAAAVSVLLVLRRAHA